MVQFLAEFVPDLGTAIIVAFLIIVAGVAFWLTTLPVGDIVDPIEAEHEPKPAVDPEDAARKAVL